MMITPISQNNMALNQPSFQGVSSAAGAGRGRRFAMRVAAGLKNCVSKSNEKVSAISKAKEKLFDGMHDFIARKLVAPVMDSKVMSNLADKTVNVNNIGAHMATAGSLVTTAVYANRTLHKKELDKKRARTLALNQCLVTAVSTVCAYTVNSKLDKLSKNLGYKFREANQGNKHLNTRMQGFNIAKQLLIFTLMYRYIAPVVVTPLASKLGNLFDKTDKKQGGPSFQAAPVVAQPDNNSSRDSFYKNLQALKSYSR